jgi:hypothetical protein
LIFLADIIWVIKPRTWRSIGYVVCMTEEKNTYRVWRRYLMERDHLEDKGRIKVDLKQDEGGFELE